MSFGKRIVVGAVAALWVGLSMSAAKADDDALEKIEKAGEIRVGIEFGRPPWAYKDANLDMTGYDMEVAQLVAKDLGVELQVVELTLPNRIPFLTSGKVNTVISTFSITPEREKVVDFSIPYGSAVVAVAAREDVKLEKIDDLKDVRVGVARGSTNDTALTEKAPFADIVRFDDVSTNVTAFTSGQVEAIATSPATIKAVAEKNPSLNIQVKFNLVEFPVGAGIRKGDDALREKINASIRKNLESGKLNSLYKKFFGIGLTQKVLLEAK